MAPQFDVGAGSEYERLRDERPAGGNEADRVLPGAIDRIQKRRSSVSLGINHDQKYMALLGCLGITESVVVYNAYV
jgi:hypothetical protein